MSLSPLIWSAYRGATSAAALAMPAWLSLRARRGKEFGERLAERYGSASRPRPAGPLVWCHAASIGETNSVLPLLRRLHGEGLRILLTTGTVTSEHVARAQLPDDAIHQFAPLDHAPWVSRFLDHWRPDIALRVDSELWPLTLAALAARRVPVAQINARMSAKAFAGWRRCPAFARDVMSKIVLVCAQTDDDCARFAALGAPHAVNAGNLKLAQTPLPFDAAELDRFKAAVRSRPVWLAASIHPGEDVIAGRAQLEVLSALPDALCIIVPRHAERGAAMAANLRALGLGVAVRSQGEPVTSAASIYMADTMGELGLFYRLAPVTVMGKSFAVGGGQNPAEPALIGAALLWGPDMSNFTALAADLQRQGAALGLARPAELGAAVAGLLRDPGRAAAMAAAGRTCIAANADALERTLAQLKPYLDRAAIS